MRKPSPPAPVLLFVATLYHDEEYFSAARRKLQDLFGDSILESQPLPWDYSGYYADELGSPILRRFIFFGNMINRETLPDIKLETYRIEEQMSMGGKRSINLDPGYITPYHVVLASTKNYSHRVYIGKGIFAEVTLIYKEKDGRYQPNLFTYRDYASDAYADIFSQARKLLK
jgi:hypothetical protein